MMALEGVPAFYIHSLLATKNDVERIEHTGNFRSINRHAWDVDQLEQQLSAETHHNKVFEAMLALLKIRRKQPAFHPNATMYTLHTGESLFAFWRQSINRSQSIFAVYNITNEPQTFNLSELNLVITDQWTDLVSGEVFDDRLAQVTLRPYQYLWLTNKQD